MLGHHFPWNRWLRHGFVWKCWVNIPNYSHLIGIMISKTIGLIGVHDIFRHTHMLRIAAWCFGTWLDDFSHHIGRNHHPNWLELHDLSILYGMSSFPLTFIFFRGVAQPPTRLNDRWLRHGLFFTPQISLAFRHWNDGVIIAGTSSPVYVIQTSDILYG